MFPQVLIFLIFSGLVVNGSLSAEEKEGTKQFILDNGMRVFLYERHNLPLINIVAAINAGSKDETPETNGLVHLLEHYILFRGTEARSGSEIARNIRRHGAYFNAHTGQDTVSFEISLPAEYADFGLNNQKDILFNLKLNLKELDVEKEVVLEELSQIHDDPFRYAFALLYQNLFSGHPYSLPVFGKAENIRALTVEQLEIFYKTYFVPANCALAVVGDFSVKEMENRVRACFGTVPKADFIPAKFVPAPALQKSIEIEEALDVQEAYLVIGTAAPDYSSPDQNAADLLTEILGRGISPLLYRPLKAERDLIHSVGMNYISLAYGGIFEVYLTLDPDRLSAAKNQALQFLRQARSENFSRDDLLGIEQMQAYDLLEGAKNRISFSVRQAQENGLTLAASLAAYLLRPTINAPLNYLDEIKIISSGDIRKTAAKYLSKGKYVLISIVPKKK